MTMWTVSINNECVTEIVFEKLVPRSQKNMWDYPHLNNLLLYDHKNTIMTTYLLHVKQRHYPHLLDRSVKSKAEEFNSVVQLNQKRNCTIQTIAGEKVQRFCSCTKTVSSPSHGLACDSKWSPCAEFFYTNRMSSLDFIPKITAAKLSKLQHQGGHFGTNYTFKEHLKCPNTLWVFIIK